jgi:hypothetical protein
VEGADIGGQAGSLVVVVSFAVTILVPPAIAQSLLELNEYTGIED